MDPVAPAGVGRVGGGAARGGQGGGRPAAVDGRPMGGVAFGSQLGMRSRSGLEVVGSTDIGLPLGPAGKAALLPLNIEASART